MSGLFVALLLAAPLQGASGAQPSPVRQFAEKTIPLVRALASDPGILRAVKQKNASGETMEQIRRTDEHWSKNLAFPLRKELTSNDCAARARELTRHDATVVEVIVMDQRGANVCASRETSDYWQGDEAKFQKTFGEGRESFIDQPAFDASSGVHAIQLGGAIFDGGKPIGAVTVTLRVTRAAVKATSGQ